MRFFLYFYLLIFTSNIAIAIPSTEARKLFNSLKNNDVIHKDAKIIKDWKSSAAESKLILIISDNCEKKPCDNEVIKVYKDNIAYYKEFINHKVNKENLDYLNSYDQIDCRIPKIIVPTTFYEPELLSIQVMAKGVEVNQLVTGSSFDNKTIFYSIGHQIGCLERKALAAFGEVIYHPDSHAGNMTYDQKTDQLYWFDVGGIFDNKDKTDYNFFKKYGLYKDIVNKKLSLALSLIQNKQDALLVIEEEIYNKILEGLSSSELEQFKFIDDLDQIKKQNILNVIEKYFNDAYEQFLVGYNIAKGYVDGRKLDNNEFFKSMLGISYKNSQTLLSKLGWQDKRISSLLSKISWEKDNTSSIYLKISAPFSSDDVILHAGSSKKTYDMKFLKTLEGMALIEAFISKLNGGMVPTKDSKCGYIGTAYNRNLPEANYNKSLIASCVSELARTN